jgi:hypothetical protein
MRLFKQDQPEPAAQRSVTGALLSRLASSADRLPPDLAAVRKLAEEHPTVDLLALDLSPGSADLAAIGLQDPGSAGGGPPAALAVLRGQQRALRLTGDVDDAARMLRADLGSGVAVARLRRDDLAARTGLDADRAARYHLAAGRTLAAVAGVMGGVLEAADTHVSRYAMTSSVPGVADYLRTLDGFADFFGNQSGCDCGHCESILGQNAYFADLMHFVHTHISGPVFVGQNESHPLYLRVRRPDLWTLPLTCDNATTLVPTLEIINEILENAIASAHGMADVTDRTAVARLVYRQILAFTDESPALPFHLPMERVRIVLGARDVDRADVIEVTGAHPMVINAARLHLSEPDRILIGRSNADPTFLRRVYGLPLPALHAIVPAIPVTDLMRAIEVSHDDLAALVGTRFVRGSGATVRLVAERANPSSIQNDIERVHGLTAAALDRMHRFIRLWRRGDWTVGELDLVLTHVGATTLTEAELVLVGEVRGLQRRLDLPLDEACALTGPLPTEPSSPDEPSLFDRRFNPTSAVEREGRYPQPATGFVHPALRDPAAPPDPAAAATQQRLQSGLGVTEAELLTLILGLHAELAIQPASGNPADRAVTLTAPHLSALYRQAKLARLLNLSILDLVRLRGHAPRPTQPAGTPAGDLDGLAALLDLYDWWHGSGRSLDDLDVIARRPPLDPGRYPQPTAVADAVAAKLSADGVLTFRETIFTSLAKMNDSTSRTIIDANRDRFVDLGRGRFQLTPDFDLDVPLTLPRGVTLDPKDLRALLAAHHLRTLLPPLLAEPLGLTTAAVAALLPLVRSPRPERTGADERGRRLAQFLTELVTELVPLAVLVPRATFSDAAVEAIVANRAAVGLDEPDRITLRTVRALAIATSLASASVTVTDVLGVLAAHRPGTGFASAHPAALAKVIGVPVELVPGLLRGVRAAVGPDAATGLRHLDAAAAMAKRLGVGGETLANIASIDYPELDAAADALLAALRDSYPETEAPQRLEPVEDEIRERRRDALVDYLLHSTFRQFATRDDLYQYFLIDTQIQGCARTSRIVAAIASVQLYVYRCLMNLEQDRRPADDPQHLAIAIAPDSIPAQEWQWRRSYRVWEANRKVFLWPENYLEPQLRDDRTPLFADLEAALLQRPVSEQSVLDAYAAYLAGFEELARLQIVGSFHEKDASNLTDVLHLVGVSQDEPRTYYHRTVTNAIYGVGPKDIRGGVWGPWRRVDVPIGSRQVAPVVRSGRLHLFWNEWVTKPKTSVVEGTTKFTAYHHTMALKFTTLRLDGRWTTPQRVGLAGVAPFRNDGVLVDAVTQWDSDPTHLMAALDRRNRIHPEPVEGYGLEGFGVDAIYPELHGDDVLVIGGANFQMKVGVDLFTRSCYPPPSTIASHTTHRPLYAAGWNEPWFNGDHSQVLYYIKPNLSGFVAEAREGFIERSKALDAQRRTALPGYTVVPAPPNLASILTLPPGPELNLVNGSIGDCIIDIHGDQLLLQGSVRAEPGYLIRRIGTRLAPTLARKLFVDGVDGLLDTAFQTNELGEPPLPVTGLNHVDGDVTAGTVDFLGPYGTYYREIFFHIPILIANHLSGQQEFAAAQRWYHYVFDPTSTEKIPKDPTLSAEQQAHRDLDRAWRYAEFRGRSVDALKDVLRRQDAIDAYLSDPFNPHAIARLRLSAYQRYVVMRYVDNLLDWADSLFAQFTTESVNEATLLYHTASAILGERPTAFGDCGPAVARTYASIAAKLEKGTEILAGLETLAIAGNGATASAAMAMVSSSAATAAEEEPEAVGALHRVERGDGAGIATVATDGGQLRSYSQAATAQTNGAVTSQYGWRKAGVTGWTRSAGTDRTEPLIGQVVQLDPAIYMGLIGWSLAGQGLIFCLPTNPELVGRWDRVERQLYKIRNCLDIDGVPRRLALMDPEIDPRLLQRARAAGIPFSEIVGSAAGVPPYRFSYLIERAKAHAGLVQSFGTALLGALERRDVEELTLLRTTQQHNMLILSGQLRRWDIEAAEDAVDALERQKAGAEYRRDYYQGLVDQVLSPSELAQVAARGQADNLNILSQTMDLTAAVAHLVPNLGAWTAITFGGRQLGDSLSAFARMTRAAAGAFEAAAANAALTAGFERRLDGWRHQVKVIKDEIGQIDKHLAAARVRVEIAQRSLELHETAIEQSSDILTFYGERFTGLGLYTWLATNLQRIYREVYNGAYAMARLAEQALRFERGDDISAALDPSYWDPARAGLLAGEGLLAALQVMERRYIETNQRSLEVDQPFSLTMLAPQALVQLRETGTADFAIDEFQLDQLYPGHYRRRIRSVRLSIPCVAGPYTNVSATLTLLGSSLRTAPDLAASAVVEVPLRRMSTIATSTAQQDAGVLEFSFRDERYLPFEGAGAASRWRLTLPQALAAFDYRTITDVILHVSYAADADGLLRQQVEGPPSQNGSLLKRLGSNPMTRVLSLRHDLASTFQRLLANPAGTGVRFAIGREHFPAFVDGRTLTVTSATMALVPKRRQGIGAASIGLNGVVPAAFEGAETLGGLPSGIVTSAFGAGLIGTHTITVANAGALAPVEPIPGDQAAIDPTRLEDVLLVISYVAT